MSFKKNIIALYLIKVSKWFTLVMPIIVLFYKECGLDLADIFILKSVYSIAMVSLGNTDGLPGRRMGTQELPNCGMHILLSGIHQLLDLRHVHGIFPLGNIAWIRSKSGVRGRFRPTLRYHATL